MHTSVRRPLRGWVIAAGVAFALTRVGPACAAERSALSVWLSGSYRTTASDSVHSERWAALIGASIAFDELYRPARPLPAPQFPAAHFGEPPADAEEGREHAREGEAAGERVTQDPAAGAPQAAAPQAAAPQAAVPQAAVAEAVVWRLTPGLIQSTLRAALRHAGAAGQSARLASLRARSRSSAALPELRLGAGRSTDQALRLSPSVSEPDRYTVSDGADLWLEARLSWKLDRLLFAREELDLERLASAASAARYRRVRQVLDALFAWQKALFDAADPAAPSDRQLLAELRALQAAAELDVLTGGWFSEQIAASQGGG
jgi:hypothetical protein